MQEVVYCALPAFGAGSSERNVIVYIFLEEEVELNVFLKSLYVASFSGCRGSATTGERESGAGCFL